MQEAFQKLQATKKLAAAVSSVRAPLPPRPARKARRAAATALRPPAAWRALRPPAVGPWVCQEHALSYPPFGPD